MAEPIDLSRLLPEARAFLTDLAQNNRRDWFQANKAQYDTALKRPSEKLLADMAYWLSGQTGTQPRTKLFRPHRDVRFTEDKTPYHTHLHMMWSLTDGRVWMLGISPEYATAGAGIMRFDPGQQGRYRDAVDGPEGAALEAMLDGWRIDPPDLKRVPAPYPDDHPREALLRRKGLVAWADDLEDRMAEDPMATLQAVFTRAGPLMDWLARIA